MIYHGIPLEDFDFHKNKSNYLFSLGRICPKKGQHIAVKVAKETGIPLILAGEINSAHNSYWKETIEPYLTFSITRVPEMEQEDYKQDLIEKLNEGDLIIDQKEIMFIGNLTDKQKVPFYKNARSFIMPIQWQEPFGLTMIESMACGTPVIATNFGSVLEVVKNNETGIIINSSNDEGRNLELIIEAIKNIQYIDPVKCRMHVEENFSAEQEAKNYLKLYQKILDRN
jgi:glycosyltransferase involved in cell wall biosynthesis